jgi:hypothetical protein
MSHLSVIDVYYSKTKEVTVPEIIDMYVQNGWTLDYFGHISLRPLGDKDDFDWIQLELNQVSELYGIIRKKVEAGEDPAVILMLKNTGVGAVTTFYPKERRIDFLLDFGRKTHPELAAWIDVSWYLPPIFKPLFVSGFGVSQIEFTEMA